MWKFKLFLAGQSWPIFGFHLTSPPSIEKLIHFSLFWSEKRNLCIKNKNKLATKFSLSAIDWFNCRNFFLQKIKRLFCKHFFGEKNDTANCELSALITSPLRGSWLEQKKSFCSSEHFFLSLSKSSSAAAASIIQIVLLRGSLREKKLTTKKPGLCICLWRSDPSWTQGELRTLTAAWSSGSTNFHLKKI